MDHREQAPAGCAPLSSLGIRLCALAVAVCMAAGGCTSARYIEPEAGGSFGETVLEALEPGQEVIVTRSDGSEVAGRMASFDGKRLEIGNGQGTVAVEVGDIAALEVREFSPAKTAVAGGAVSVGVLIALLGSAMMAMWGAILQ